MIYNNNLYNFYTLGEKEYFIVRENNNQISYEEEYWSTVKDPDGKKRDRLKEREQY
jgi:hypothetical protein